MPDTKPSEPNPNLGTVADESVGAGIADETASYDQAMKRKHDAEPQDSEDVADSVTGNG